MKNRILLTVFAIVMMFALSSCGEKKEENILAKETIPKTFANEVSYDGFTRQAFDNMGINVLIPIGSRVEQVKKSSPVANGTAEVWNVISEDGSRQMEIQTAISKDSYSARSWKNQAITMMGLVRDNDFGNLEVYRNKDNSLYFIFTNNTSYMFNFKKGFDNKQDIIMILTSAQIIPYKLSDEMLVDNEWVNKDLLSNQLNLLVMERSSEHTVYMKQMTEESINYDKDALIFGLTVDRQWFEKDQFESRENREITVDNVRIKIQDNNLYIHKSTLQHYGLAR